MIFVVLFSVVGLSSEYAIGRRARTGALGAYRDAWRSRNKKLGSAGSLVGALPLVGSLCIAIGYAIIIAYVLKAFYASVTGELMSVNTGAWFDGFSSAEMSVVPFHIIVVVVTALTLLLGAKSIEKSNKIMMPVFFVVFVILAVRVAFLPGAAKGYQFMFTFRWTALKDPMVWVWAMGQAFFSLSIIGSGMITYGAYLQDDADVVKMAVRTAVLDTVAALVAAMVIIPACFAYGLDVGAGPGLLFVTLPKILQDIPLGQVFAIILYIAMIFAGVSSLQNMFESVAESVENRYPKFKRKLGLIIISIICLGVGLFMEPIGKWGPWMDIVSIYIIPIGATIGAISWFWIMKKRDLMEEINKGAARPRGNLWYNMGRWAYVLCAIILCVVALVKKVAF